MAGNRFSDKTEPLKIIISLIPIIFSFIILYMIVPLKTDMREMRQELKSEINTLKNHQDSQFDQFYQYYENCKNEINNIRKETSEQYNKLKDQIRDQLMAMLKDKKALN